MLLPHSVAYFFLLFWPCRSVFSFLHSHDCSHIGLNLDTAQRTPRASSSRLLSPAATSPVLTFDRFSLRCGPALPQQAQGK
ncbi:hypothetical protein IWX49DRAFT_575910 [Phyllosticta citricarpa]